MQTIFHKRIMKINHACGLEKTNPNKPNLKDKKNPSGCLFIDRMRFLYKPVNDQYYIRHIGRCSSTVEHGFRKAGVVGPNPTIGFVIFLNWIHFIWANFQTLY